MKNLSVIAIRQVVWRRSNLKFAGSLRLFGHDASFACSILILLVSVTTLLLSSCGPTYHRDSITDSLERLAKKEYKLVVEAKDVGDTVGIQYVSPSLMQELVDTKTLNSLLMLLSRVAVSSDRPPKFLVLDIVDEKNPRVHLLFTQYTPDLKKMWGEAMSQTDFFDRQIMEYMVNGKRAIFDAKDMDTLDLMVMAGESSADTSAGTADFELTDVKMTDFLALVSANATRRILRDKEKKEKHFFVRDVSGLYIGEGPEQGTFRIFIDLVGRPNPTPFLDYLTNTLLPSTAEEVKKILKTYKFDSYTQIMIVEKNSGKTYFLKKHN